MSDDGLFGLLFDAIHQRLDRIEAELGITEKVPADVEIDALLAEEDDE